MDTQFILDRITELRIQKGVSEYQMSLDLGHSRSYVNKISSGKCLPSIPEFLYICEYLGVTPKEFFTVEPLTGLQQKAIESIQKLDDKEILSIVEQCDKISDLYYKVRG